MALSVAIGPLRPQASRAGFACFDGHLQARHHRGALHLQMDHRRARGRGERRERFPYNSRYRAWRAARLDDPLRLRARPDGGLDANARGPFRARRLACGPPPRASHLRAHAPLVAALPSRTQDRRPHTRARARPAWHRGVVPPHHDDGHSDRHRIRARDLGSLAAFRLALRRARDGHDRHLSLLHGGRDELADRHPTRHEQFGYRGDHQGRRQPAQLRDGQIFRGREARGRALRLFHGALREIERAVLHLARRAQHGPSGDLHRGPDDGDGALRARRHGRHRDGW